MEIACSRSSADWKGRISGVEVMIVGEVVKVNGRDGSRESAGAVVEGATKGALDVVVDGVIAELRERIEEAVLGGAVKARGVELVSEVRDVGGTVWTDAVTADSVVAGARIRCAIVAIASRARGIKGGSAAKGTSAGCLTEEGATCPGGLKEDSAGTGTTAGRATVKAPRARAA